MRDQSLPGSEAPALTEPRPIAVPVSNIHLLEKLELDEFDASRPGPRSISFGAIAEDDMEWAANLAWRSYARVNEGAAFMNLTPDVVLIPVRGGQPLHHDRHIAYADLPYVSEHTWNLVVEPSEDQQLLIETEPGFYEHFHLSERSFVYFNTCNNHMISRSKKTDWCVIAQVQGFGPQEGQEAAARLREVLQARPAMMDAAA